jgi:cysteinyl-tRNA synthetase
MRLYNTYSRKLDDLPQPPGPVRMYFCGPTVYERAHVGNAVPFVLGMWLRSWLRSQGYDVTLVHNITDINDKIYDAAPGASAELAARASQWYLEDTGDLGLGMPDHMPKASELVPEIVRFIEALIESGHAYAVDGDVYFRVASFPDYGRLSGQRPDQVEDQEPNPLKEDPRDFALWKANKPGEDTSWESPWGRGRPGWHIECSVMAEELLGPVFEIHGGGLDLVFPHHENELAQSRALGHDFAQIWMHNGLLEFTDEKMSKSIGNFVTIRDAVDRYGKEALLVFFMTGHWRKPLDFSEETMAAAEARAESFREVFRNPSVPAADGEWERFTAALDDDFNTPDALAVMHGWRDHELLRRALDVFGLGALGDVTEDVPAEVIDLAERRKAARASGEYGEADRLRGEVERAGWELRDVAEAPGYRLVRRR